MSNRARHHTGRRSPPSLRLLPPEPPPQSPLRAVLESDGPGAFSVRDLASCVGGVDALERLDIEPLAPGAFDATQVPAAHRPLALSIEAALEAGIDAFNRPFDSLRSAIGRPELPPPFDEEYLAIARRILHRLTTTDGRVLATSTPRRTAAAIAWVAFRGSQQKRGRRKAVTADGIWRAFGVSNCAALATTLRRALDVPRVDPDDNWQDVSSLWLPEPQLLHSTARTWILRSRTSALQVCATLAREAAERRPVQLRPDGKVQIKARHVVPFSAFRAPDTTGRHTVVTVFGDLDDPEVIALSVPDARRLVEILQRALDQPTSQTPGV